MPANATKQITEYSGGDSAVSDSLRQGEQHVVASQEQSGNQASRRTAVDDRQADVEKTEKQSSERNNSTDSESERNQTTDGEQNEKRTSLTVTTTEKPQRISRTTQGETSETQVTYDDIAMTVSFELEITSPLSK